jgi:flagellar hook assembly protein FlgD
MAYEDLLKDTSVQSSDPGYFLVTITDLDPLKLYPLQLRWKYNDNTFGPWSAVKSITTPTETVPSTPNLGVSDVVGGNGYIKITWDGNDSSGNPIQNIDRVNIHISGGTFGVGTQVVDFFKTEGTKTIVAAPGTYIVQLKSITVANTTSFFSLSRTVEVTGTEEIISDPEDPSAPTLTAGKASIIVSWDGKNSSNTNFTAGSFFGAKVYIGKTSSFTPSENNWVHTLNFANGSNQVSIGVGTVIDKSTSELLDFDTNYYIKIGTLNANGETTGNFISATGNPIQVEKTAFSEIEAGILSADAYIQAGPCYIRLRWSHKTVIISVTAGRCRKAKYYWVWYIYWRHFCSYWNIN